METALYEVIIKTTTLEKLHGNLINEHKNLQDKCTNLENRSRQQNLHIIGIAEGSGSAAEIFSVVLDSENFVMPIIIDWLKPQQGEHVQVLTVHQLCYRYKDKILKKARTKGHLTYKGSPVIILWDMKSEVGKLHA